MSASIDAIHEPLSDTELRDWVTQHHACWETTVHREWTPAGVRPVGYDVLVSATCVGHGPWDPAGERARAMLARMRQLIEQITPNEGRADVHVEPLEPVFQLRPQTDWRPEVRIVVEVRHGSDLSEGLDDDERAGVGRLERGLERWGAARGAWPTTRKAQT
jgi:hypothetical protein